MTNTQLNIVGLAANAGTYISGPILGRVVDAHGPRIPLIKAFIFCLVGYGGIKRMFDEGVGPGEILSPLQFATLVLYSSLTGFGAGGAISSAVNATAKSFPQSMHATATGLVVSGFGLSAFFFSTMARTFFPGDPSALLLLLALTTSMPMLLALIVVRPIPLPSTHLPSKADQYEDPDSTSSEAVLPSIRSTNAVGIITKAVGIVEADERQPLLGASVPSIPGTHAIGIMEGNNSQLGAALPSVHGANAVGIITNTVGMIGTDSRQPLLGNQRVTNYQGVPESSTLAEMGLALSQSHSQAEELPGICGIKLLKSPDFYLLITIVSLLTGTGLMYINNVGLITLALYAKANPVYDEIAVSAWQTAQVSILSISNCAGRILIGMISDFMQTYLHLPRAYSLCIVSSLFIISQMAVMSVSSITALWMASVMVGVAYGSLLGVLPSVVIDWFGLAHQSENSGWVMLSPLPSVNFFAIMFGRNLDAHTPSQDSELLAHTQRALPVFSKLMLQDTPLERQCLLGRECYVSSLQVTLMVSMVSLMLSVLAVIRDAWRNRTRARSNE